MNILSLYFGGSTQTPKQIALATFTFSWIIHAFSSYFFSQCNIFFIFLSDSFLVSFPILSQCFTFFTFFLPSAFIPVPVLSYFLLVPPFFSSHCFSSDLFLLPTFSSRCLYSRCYLILFHLFSLPNLILY